jgi:hypothetical protein
LFGGDQIGNITDDCQSTHTVPCVTEKVLKPIKIKKKTFEKNRFTVQKASRILTSTEAKSRLGDNIEVLKTNVSKKNHD